MYPQHPECLPIPVSPQDHFFGPLGIRCLEFARSGPAPKEDCEFGPREQLTQVTSYLDASMVYSSHPFVTDSLRLFRNGEWPEIRFLSLSLLFFVKIPYSYNTLRDNFIFSLSQVCCSTERFSRTGRCWPKWIPTFADAGRYPRAALKPATAGSSSSPPSLPSTSFFSGCTIE